MGEIRVYIDENFVEQAREAAREGRPRAGQELAGAFSSLRANDLIWSYVVNNYLKGKQPPAFDLLYWNADATNLPGPMYAYYLRNTYQDNKLCKPDALTMLRRAGEPEAHQAAGVRLLGARGPHRAVEGRLRERAHAGRQGDVRARRERAHRRHDQPGLEEQAQLLDERRARRATPTQWLARREGGAGQLVARVDRSG